MKTHDNKELTISDSIGGMKHMAESFFDAVILISGDSIQHLNKAAIKLFGYDSDELKEKPISIISPEIFRAIHNNEYQEPETESQGSEYQKINIADGIRKDGAKLSLEYKISSSTVKNETYSIVVVRNITEQKKIDDEIFAKEKFFDDICESMNEPFYVINVDDYSVAYANKAARGDNFRPNIKCYELIHNLRTPCDEDDESCPVNLIKKINKPAIINRTQKDKNGNKRISEVHAHPLFDLNGKLRQITKFSFDITDRVKNEKELQKWANVVKMNPSPVIEFNNEGKVVLLNPAAMDYFGILSDQNILLSELFPDIDNDIFIESITSGGSFAFEHCVAGRDFHFTIKGATEYGIGHIFSHDITKRKKAENELKKLEKAILDAMVSVVITDADGIIEFANPSFTKFTGYPVEEVIGENPRLLNSGEHSKSFYKNIWDTLKSGQSWEGDFCNRKKNGEYYWQFSHISPVVNDRGEITHFVDVSEDITEKKNARDELLKLNKRLKKSEMEVLKEAKILAETNEKLFESEIKLKKINDAKDKFFSIIAHDLRGPFSGFIGLSELLEKEYNNLDAESIARISKSMSKSAKQLFNLLENLLEWSKAQMGKMEFNPMNIDLYDFAKRISGLFLENALQKDIDLIVDIKKGSFIFADSYMLNTILRNLVSNALKFTPRGGEVVMNADDYDDNFIRIIVRDNGVGMKDEAMEKIFRMDSKYSTAGTENERGTGLGLLLCKELVELNGGNIWVDSKPEEGSAFQFTLPNGKSH